MSTPSASTASSSPRLVRSYNPRSIAPRHLRFGILPPLGFQTETARAVAEELAWTQLTLDAFETVNNRLQTLQRQLHGREVFTLSLAESLRHMQTIGMCSEAELRGCADHLPEIQDETEEVARFLQELEPHRLCLRVHLMLGKDILEAGNGAVEWDELRDRADVRRVLEARHWLCMVLPAKFSDEEQIYEIAEWRDRV